MFYFVIMTLSHNFDFVQKHAPPPSFVSKWKPILYLICGWIIPLIPADEHFPETHTHKYLYCRCDGNAGSGWEMLICVARSPNSAIVSRKSYAESEVWIIWIIPFKAFAQRVSKHWPLILLQPRSCSGGALHILERINNISQLESLLHAQRVD